MHEPTTTAASNSADEPIPADTHRRGGNPRMLRGAPSVNPRGRPRAGESLARAIRDKWPAARIVELAERMLETTTSERVRLGVLQLLALRGYGLPRAPVSAGSDRESSIAPPLLAELAQGVDG